MIIRYQYGNFHNTFIKPAVLLPLVRLLFQTRTRCAANLTNTDVLMTACVTFAISGPSCTVLSVTAERQGHVSERSITHAPCGASHMLQPKHVYCTDCG